MNFRGISAIVAGLAIALATSTTAAAETGLALQVIAAEAASQSELENDLDVDDFGEGDGHALANCQWFVAYNNAFVTLAEVEGLALVTDDDAIDLDIDTLGPRGTDIDVAVVEDTETGNASCHQTVGTYRIVDERESGWGEVAPQGETLTSLGSGWFGSNSLGGGDLDAVIQIAVASAFQGVELENDADIDFSDGDGAALSNCQFFFSANTVVLTATKATASATVSDDDLLDVEIGDPPNGGIYEPIAGASGNDIIVDDRTFTDSGTSACTQTVDLFEIIIGGDRDDNGAES